MSKAHFWTQNNHHLGRSSKHLRSIVRKSSAWKKSALCCCLKLCFMGILCEWETWRHFQRNQRNVRHSAAAHHIYVFISKTLMSCQISSSIGKLYKNACAQFLGSDGTRIEKGAIFLFSDGMVPNPVSHVARSQIRVIQCIFARGLSWSILLKVRRNDMTWPFSTLFWNIPMPRPLTTGHSTHSHLKT